MKKQILLASLIGILLLSFSGISSAQIVYMDNYSSKTNSHRRSYNYYYWGYYSNYGLNHNKLKTQKVKDQDVTTYNYKKDGQRAIQKSRSFTKYNADFLRIEWQSFRKGKEQNHVLYEYNSNGDKTDIKRNNKGKSNRQTINTYDDSFQLTNKKYYYKNELRSNSYAIYKDTVLITQYTFKKDSITPAYRWGYSYYPTGDKKQTQYFKKGELKKTWSYTCDDEGLEVKPKEEIKICELKQYNADSTYVIINRTTNKKGKISKFRTTYNKEDRIILEESINVKGQTTYKQATEFNKAGKMTKRTDYHRGKYADKISTLVTRTYLQDTIRAFIKRQYFKKKDQTIWWASENKYNEKGRLIESKSFGKGNELKDIDTYSYNVDNQITSGICINADGTLKSKSIYKYNPKGLLTETHTYDEDNFLTRSIIRKYQYFE